MKIRTEDNLHSNMNALSMNFWEKLYITHKSLTSKLGTPPNFQHEVWGIMLIAFVKRIVLSHAKCIVKTECSADLHRKFVDALKFIHSMLII